MEEALIALMLADAGVSAALGARVQWNWLAPRRSGRPYATLTLISSPDSYVYAGLANFSQWRVQLDLWGETMSGVTTAMRACRKLLSGYSGVVSGIRFQGIFIEGGQSGAEAGPGGDGQLHRRSLDLMISWNTET